MITIGTLRPGTIVDVEYRLIVSAEYHLVEAQRLVRQVSEALGLQRTICYQVATAITELASNILRYAGTGELWIRQIHLKNEYGIEIIALDNGPGLDDPAQALIDGFTTGGGLGGGLPGVSRLMDEMLLSSTLGAGTQVVARKWRVSTKQDYTPDHVNLPVLDIGVVWRPFPGETMCGDAGQFWWEGSRLMLALADGLGHGPEAQRAAYRALDFLKLQTDLPLLARVTACDQALLDTRGIALGLVAVEPSRQQLSFLGVGNIRALVRGPKTRRLVCGYGIVGAGFDTPFLDKAPFVPGDEIILTSDGIEDLFDPSRINAQSSAQSRADALLHAFALARDDAAVLVCRWPKEMADGV
ncbi:phosphoserine phosphatase RsbX [Gammaproteobacteria bacterium]